MQLPDRVTALLAARHAENPDWWQDRYRDAVQRVEDRTADTENPYWWSPANDLSMCPGDGVYDEFGGGWDVDELERAAFEMLVLADLARASDTPEQ